MDWQALCLKTPGEGGSGERHQVRTGQQEWPLASFFTVVEGDQKQRPRRLYLSRKMTGSMPPVSTSLWPVFPFWGEKASNLLSTEESSKRTEMGRTEHRT